MREDDISALRRGMRDLVALTTLPALWARSTPREIAESLSEVLLNLLRLDLVFIRLTQPSPEDRTIQFEVARTPQQLIAGEQAQQIGKLFAPYCHVDFVDTLVEAPDPLGKDPLQIAVIPIGYEGCDGFIVAGTHAFHSIGEIHRVLLGVAANQAVTALNQARLYAAEREARELAEQA